MVLVRGTTICMQSRSHRTQSVILIYKRVFADFL